MFKLLLSVLSGLYFFALNVRDSFLFPKQLSKEEEEKLIDRMEAGDEEAKKKLIEHNLRLVSHVAKKYYSKTGDMDELISIGTIGLVKGVNSFKKEKSTKLSTYLAKCIQNEILMFFRNQKKINNTVYINDPIEFDSEGNPLTFMDLIKTEDTIADDINDKINIEKLKKYVNEIGDKREKTVIIKRYGLDGKDPLTQLEVSKQLGISRSYVSRIEKKVIEDLRKKFEQWFLKEFINNAPFFG